MGKAFEVVLSVLIRIGAHVYGILACVLVVLDFVSQRILGLTVLVVDSLGEFTLGPGQVTFSDYGSYLAFANSILPLQEAWTLLAFMIPYMVAITSYRFVKQWLPTISN